MRKNLHIGVLSSVERAPYLDTKTLWLRRQKKSLLSGNYPVRTGIWTQLYQTLLPKTLMATLLSLLTERNGPWEIRFHYQQLLYFVDAKIDSLGNQPLSNQYFLLERNYSQQLVDSCIIKFHFSEISILLFLLCCLENLKHANLAEIRQRGYILHRI